jgi:hypothetical protein
MRHELAPPRVTVVWRNSSERGVSTLVLSAEGLVSKIVGGNRLVAEGW